MYSKIYNQASALADRIREGGYSTPQPTNNGFLSRPQEEEVVEEVSDMDAIIEMMMVIRASAKDNVKGIAVQESKRPKSRGDKATDVGKLIVKDLMDDFGLTKAQAAGIVGNLDHETGGFAFMQEIKPVVPGSRGGYGWAQWTGPRRVEFEEFVETHGYDVDGYEGNYYNLVRELTQTPEGRVLDKIKQTDTAEDAAVVFSETFLRPGVPNLPSRIGKAYRYMEGDTDG